MRDPYEMVKEVSESQGLKEEAPVKQIISTGCTLLDLAILNIHPGGIPLGRTVQIYGAESTCKTVLGMTLLGSVQRQNGIAFFGDVENTFDPVWAKLFGLDCCNKDIWKLGCWWDKKNTEYYIRQPSTIEELFDEYIAEILAIEDNRPKVVVVDSLTALPSSVEAKDSMDSATYGATRAKAIRLGFRKYQSFLAETNTSLIFIDQTIDNIGVIFGEKETTSGGRALKFFSSVRLHLKNGEKVKNSKEKEIGIWVNFKVSKNKTAPPFRTGRFKIIWDYGIDNIATSLDFIQENSVEVAEEAKGTKGEKKRKSGWIEFAGAGMFRPEMLENLGIKGQAIAWGMGIDRLAMFKLGINDIRHLFSEDLSYLRNSKGVLL